MLGVCGCGQGWVVVVVVSSSALQQCRRETRRVHAANFEAARPAAPSPWPVLPARLPRAARSPTRARAACCAWRPPRWRWRGAPRARRARPTCCSASCRPSWLPSPTRTTECGTTPLRACGTWCVGGGRGVAAAAGAQHSRLRCLAANRLVPGLSPIVHHPSPPVAVVRCLTLGTHYTRSCMAHT